MHGLVDILTAELDADTQQMLKVIACELENLGYVKNGYEEALVEREKEYPTGLAVEHLINVAIPHADIEYALRQAIVIIKHSNTSFRFGKMDEPNKSIPVSAVFLLVLKESEGYMRFLADLAELFQDHSFIETVKEDRPASIAKFLKDKLDKYNLRYKGQLDFPGRNKGLPSNSVGKPVC